VTYDFNVSNTKLLVLICGDFSPQVIGQSNQTTREKSRVGVTSVIENKTQYKRDTFFFYVKIQIGKKSWGGGEESTIICYMNFRDSMPES